MKDHILTQFMQSQISKDEHSLFAHASDHQVARLNHLIVYHLAAAQKEVHHLLQHALLHHGPSFPVFEQVLTKKRVEQAKSNSISFNSK